MAAQMSGEVRDERTNLVGFGVDARCVKCQAALWASISAGPWPNLCPQRRAAPRCARSREKTPASGPSGADPSRSLPGQRPQECSVNRAARRVVGPPSPVQVLAADHASSPASPLRVVHRGVGRCDHIIGGLEAIRTYSDANADGRDEPVCPDLVGCSEQLAEALSDHKDRLCSTRGLPVSSVSAWVIPSTRIQDATSGSSQRASNTLRALPGAFGVVPRSRRTRMDGPPEVWPTVWPMAPKTGQSQRS